MPKKINNSQNEAEEFVGLYTVHGMRYPTEDIVFEVYANSMASAKRQAQTFLEANYSTPVVTATIKSIAPSVPTETI